MVQSICWAAPIALLIFLRSCGRTYCKRWPTTLKHSVPVLEELLPVHFVCRLGAEAAVQQCVKPLGYDVAELLVRCPAGVGERIVRQLLSERSGGGKAPFGGIAVEEQPILVV